MASKRGRLTRGSSSRAAPNPNAPTFPDLKFISKSHAEKYLKLVDYHIVKERVFALDDLQGFGEVGEDVQQRRLASFNNLIHETNKNIGMEFYANAPFGEQEDQMSDQSLRARLVTAKEMEKYLTYQEQEQARRRDHMCTKWTRQNNDFNNTINDMPDLFRNNDI
ncbi:hypothetical protein KIW84_062369 [Lathyrus oleraceus]|uniref:Uncharacterized protein n=1 Tax=Pisum sativum TaxID=3888 RepID=A0A9D4W5M7_PEA|nr:hypothetical protein KIW84_062369 [Pisum sativum]